ncbi:MAG TPA: cadherin-like beta sandwich domain-containing protein, partial [Lachnospiraceae bacterium]|nr:cadherin-like beta sandwich domain-containing protein [Lachnospiraceae bacterium]
TLAVTRNAVLSEPTVNTYSGMYDGSAHTFSVESDTEGVQITYTTGISEPVSTPPSFTEPGSYTISYTLTKEGYDDYTGSGTLEIQPSADATLSALHLSVNTADYAYTPEFASDTDVYAATVDYAVTEIELLPVTTDTQASYTINGTAVGDLSSATTVSLAEGKNEIPIEVTAQSGVDKKTYTLYVLRKEEAGGAAAPSNYYIAGGVFKGTAPYTISLMDGSTTVAETTSSSGEFVFEGLASGIYNLSIKDSSSPVKSMIVKQTITDQNITDAKYIFPTGDVNSSLEVSANTPKVRVGNLMEEALEHEVSGSQVDLTLNVSAEAAEEGTGQTAIEDQADGRTLLYLKITVDLTTVDLNTGETTETPLTSTNKVLEIIIPYDFSGKENIAVYRYHGSEVQEFTQLSALPESPVDLTCYLDTSNNYIYLYTSN